MNRRGRGRGLCPAILTAAATLAAGCGGHRECAMDAQRRAGTQPTPRDVRSRQVAAQRAVDRAADGVERSLRARADHSPTILALSGGGELGAFGAGFMKGWTEAGTRPDFDVVTGVSTGSLLATFAFLGPDYDETLRVAYTTLTSDQVYDTRWIIAWPFSDSLATTKRLRRLVEGSISDEVVAKVGRELTERNRRLIVAAVNLDEGTFVPFDLTEIASSGAPDARERYIDALMASAAIPVMFPPVFIDGSMYVDGGTRRNVFIETLLKRVAAVARGTGGNAGPPTVYVLLNNHLDSERDCVQDNLLGVGLRSMHLLLNEALYGNVLRIYHQSQELHVDFRLAFIPLEACESEANSSDDMFNQRYMRCLYDYGREAAKRADGWHTTPFELE